MESVSTEVVGSVHVILQLSEQLLRLGKRCHVLIKGISSTYQEIEEFGRMFSTFSDNLYLFHSEVHELRNQNCPIIQEHRIQELVSDVLKLSKSKMRPIRDALRQLQALRDDESLTSLVKAKIKWAIRDRQNLRKLLISIEPVRLHILQLAKVFRLHLCYSEIQKLRSELKSVPPQLMVQLKTLNKWNRRLRRECQAATQRYEENCATASFTTSETRDLLQSDVLEKFVNGVRELTQEEHTVSQNLLVELKETLGDGDSETTSVSNGDLENHRPPTASSQYSGFDHTTMNRRWTDSTTARPNIVRSQMSYPSTVSLSIASVSSSRSRVERGRSTKVTRNASGKTPGTSRPDIECVSQSINLKETPSDNPTKSSSENRPHANDHQAIPTRDVPPTIKPTPSEPYLDEAVPIEGTQNWFEIDQNGSFSIDRVPIRNKSTTPEPNADHEDNKQDDDDDDDDDDAASSSSFAPSSMYNCLSTSSVSVEYHRDNRPHAPPIFISESYSETISDVPSMAASVSSWEDWDESDIGTAKRAMSELVSERGDECSGAGAGCEDGKMYGWCRDLAHAIVRIEAERGRGRGRCPCDDCMRACQVRHPEEHRRGVPLLM